MANPQLENGYTPIANEILDALARTRIPGCARQVLDVIIRKTYGWQKKADAISLSQISKATGLQRPHVVKARQVLVAMRLIKTGVTQKGTSSIVTYWFNKDYESWKVLPKKVTVTQKGNRGVCKKVTGGVCKKVHTKETNTKETIQKKDTGSFVAARQFWMAQYRDQIGREYGFQTKDGVALSKLLKLVDLDTFKATARWLLVTAERWYCDNRTLPILLSKINEIQGLMQKTTHGGVQPTVGKYDEVGLK